MRRARALLAIDALVNIALGLVLLSFPAPLIDALGLPGTTSVFYPSILGAVLCGIGVALAIEYRRVAHGLGLGGAVAINLCGAAALAFWLLSGRLDLPLRGQAILWLLVVILAGLSGAEAVANPGKRRKR